MSMEILVFKTDIRDRRQFPHLEQHLDHLPGIIKWNVDLHDIDNILRIESEAVCPRTIEQHLLLAGFYCEELAD